MGVTTTEGDLIFAGALTGDLPALDARTGKVLLRSALAGPVGGRVVTYNSRGMQNVTAAMTVWYKSGHSETIVPEPHRHLCARKDT